MYKLCTLVRVVQLVAVVQAGRNQGRFGKVGVMRGFTWLIELLASLKGDRVQMRQQSFLLLARQCRQNPVCEWLGIFRRLMRRHWKPRLLSTPLKLVLSLVAPVTPRLPQEARRPPRQDFARATQGGSPIFIARRATQGGVSEITTTLVMASFAAVRGNYSSVVPAFATC